MGIKQLHNYNLRKLPNKYGDVSVMYIQASFNQKKRNYIQTSFPLLLLKEVWI